MNTGTTVKQYLVAQGKKPPSSLISDPNSSKAVTNAMDDTIKAFVYLVDAMDSNSTGEVIDSIAALRWSIEEIELSLGAKPAVQNDAWNILKGKKNESSSTSSTNSN